MDIKEELQIVDGLKTTPEFLSCLDFAIQKVEKEPCDFQQMALFFFSQGYMACLDFMKTKEMTRPFKYDPSCH